MSNVSSLILELRLVPLCRQRGKNLRNGHSQAESNLWMSVTVGRRPLSIGAGTMTSTLGELGGTVSCLYPSCTQRGSYLDNKTSWLAHF